MKLTAPMTSYERFRGFSAREPIDRPLRYAGFTPDLQARLVKRLGIGVQRTARSTPDPQAEPIRTVEEEIISYFEMDEPAYILPHAPPGYVPVDYSAYHRDSPAGTQITPDGVGHRPGSLYHFTERIGPLRHAERIEELESFPVLNYDGWDTSFMAQETARHHANGRFVCVPVGHIYEHAWAIRGYEQFLMDLATRPEWCEVLLDKCTRRNVNLARAGAAAGVDILRCGDDVANQKSLMFRPEIWRRLMKPRWAQVWAVARSIKPDIQILYHSDGNVESLIGELREIGMTILNPLQPECMDLDRIAATYKGRLLFDGGMGTQSVFPFGSPEDVKRAVRRLVKLFGQDLILAPTHVLEPEVPIENVQAFFDACNAERFAEYTSVRNPGGPSK